MWLCLPPGFEIFWADWDNRGTLRRPSIPTYLPPSFGHDRYLHVLRQTQDLRGDTAISQELPAPTLWAHQKNLGDSLTASKIHNCRRGRFSLQDSCFDMEMPRKIQMLLHCLSFEG